ncbi:MAG: hypothetical protein JWN50_426 [Parcubacteria group bacterium]|nr:hypothetical protein [Parcubacteria group bacterium]
MQETNAIHNECAVIVSSCAAYQDVWDPFFRLFFEYWPDCPYDIYLVSDKIGYSHPLVKNIIIENDMGWPRNTRYAVEKIGAPYFMMFMEDFLMVEKVDTERVKKLVEYVREKHIDYLRLYPTPGPDTNFDKEMRVGEIALDAPYRLSLMTAIWKKDAFLELLHDDETIWQMELLGSERARDPKYRFWSVDTGQPAIAYVPSTAIKKGVWRYDAVMFCKKHGIVIDSRTRPIETRDAYIRRRLKNLPLIGRVLRRLI